MSLLPRLGERLRPPPPDPQYSSLIFRSSSSYWKERHQRGLGASPGSQGHLAEFKASAINRFVKENGVASVIEFGCGDGGQLKLAEYPRYIGIDISLDAITSCRTLFQDDPGKQFFRLDSKEHDDLKCDMAISLDVIYYLVEDSVFESHMKRLTGSATRFLCIYSSNVELPGHLLHIRHRCFSDWLELNAPEWMLIKCIRNAFPYSHSAPRETSWSDLYFFGRAAL